MLFDYNENEKLLLDDIQAQFKAPLDKAFTSYCEAETEFQKLDKKAQDGKRSLTADEAKTIAELEQSRTEYSNLLAEYEKKRRAVTRKAEIRALRYFAKHTDELAERLEFEIEAQVASFGILQNHPDIQAVYQDDEEIRKRLLLTCGRYLDVLLKHDAENYQRVIDFISSSIADKDTITQTYKMKIESTPSDGKQSKSRWDDPYTYLLQNNATNDFNKVARLTSGRGTFSQWDEKATYTQGNLTVEIPHYDQLLQNASIGKGGELKTTMKKVLDIASIVFSRNGHNPSIRFSLDEYMELCGLTDEKEARRQVNTALEVLFDLSISYDDSKNKNRSRNYRDIRLVDDKGIKNGTVYLHFAHAFSEMLEGCPVMPYPLAILKASKGREHRNSYFIARKMTEHKNMNAGKTNENTISVRTLLEAAPFLPTEEEVRGSNSRSLTDRIINPFTNDLEEACTILGLTSEGYELHYAGGAEIPDDELLSLDYETFIDAYVRFDTWPDYPDQTQRLEAKVAKAKAASEAPKRKRRTKKGGKSAQE